MVSDSNSSSYSEKRYLRAKEHLLERLNRENSFAKALRPSDIYTGKLKQVGLNIVKHIEKLKASVEPLDVVGRDQPVQLNLKKLDENVLTIDDLTETLDTLDWYITMNPAFLYSDEILTLGGLLTQLKTKIDTEEYDKLVTKIGLFVGLCLILASIALLTFCIATGGEGLIPLAVFGLLAGQIIMAATMAIYGEQLDQAYERGQVSNYFFKSTTPDSERARKTLSIILESDESVKQQNPTLGYLTRF